MNNYSALFRAVYGETKKSDGVLGVLIFYLHKDKSR